MLSDKIKENILPLITNDYIFLDLPYYTNIGDTLIYKGTVDFLTSLPYKCLYRSSIETYVAPKISEEVVILLQGGGNFGDIWRRHTEFCLKVLKDFPDNPVIILPQTVYYKCESLLCEDASNMAKHKNLTICARDYVTYELLETYFNKNNILLAPDMAFCISKNFLNKYKVNEENKMLFLKRKDQELKSYDFKKYLPGDEQIDENEWPSMDFNLFPTKILEFLFRLKRAYAKEGILHKIFSKLINWYAIKIYMPYLLKVGISFMSKYKYVYTTRLHGAILSVLLDKSITFFDNSYGKNSTFYKTWLIDCPNIEMVYGNVNENN